MKRKVKQQPNIPFYSDEPAVSKTLMADRPPVQGSLSNKPPRMVDKHPGQASGLAGFVSKAKPGQKSTGIKVPKLRMSGHSGAHRIGGALKIPKLKGGR